MLGRRAGASVSDACLTGVAVGSRIASPEVVARIGEVPEKSRFRVVGPLPGPRAAALGEVPLLAAEEPRRDPFADPATVRGAVAPRRPTADPFADFDSVVSARVRGRRSKTSYPDNMQRASEFVTSPSSPPDGMVMNIEFKEVGADFMSSSEWRTDFSYPIRSKEHIGILEARGVLSACRHVLRAEGGLHHSHLHVSDNLGNVFMFEKGGPRTSQCS